MAKHIHAVAVAAHKWGLGKAMCGNVIGRYTPTSDCPAKVNCKRCRTRLLAHYAEAVLVELPGTDRRAVRGTARVWAEAGRFVVSAVTERMQREGVDSAGDVFIASGVAALINGEP